MINRFFRRYGFDLLFFCALIAGEAIFFQYNSFRTMRSFDMSIFIDGSWRVFNGERPHVDFPFGTGALHFYTMTLFYHLLGFGKTAMWAHLATISAMAAFAVFAIARPSLPRLYTYAVTALAAVSFYWGFSFPWYTHTSHLWGLLGIAALAPFLPLKDPQRAFRTGFVCAVAAGLSLITKTNVGAAYIVLFAMTFAVSAHRRAAFKGYALSFLTVFPLLLLVFESPVQAYLREVILGYSAQQTFRLKTLLKVHKTWDIWFVNHYWIICLTTLAAVWNRRREEKEALVLLFGMWGMAVATTFTSGAVYQVDVQLLGAMMALAFIILRRSVKAARHRWGKLARRAAFLGLVVLTVALTSLHARYGLNLKGWTHIYFGPFTTIKNPEGNYVLRRGTLKGWRCDSYLGKSLDTIIGFFEEEVPAEDRMLVLTDLQLLYAMTGRRSFPGMPLSWVDFWWPIKGPMMDGVVQSMRSDWPEWIISHSGRIAFGTTIMDYLGIKDEVFKQYVLYKETGNYVILLRKKNLHSYLMYRKARGLPEPDFRR